jgi:hypothetical protein
MPNTTTIERRNASRKANYDQTRVDLPYRFWGAEEDKAIMAADRPSDRELSAKLERSVQAIQIRRSRLGGAR